jgi:RNA polymerase sigma factor (sigma-70 family)
MEDRELLRQYVAGSEAAFAEIARRHASLVHSAALRQVRGPAEAEDVTQAVFILLARKAPQLREDVILSAWLFKAVRWVAGTQRRAEARRRERERKAITMREETRPSSSVELQPDRWDDIAPLLDEGINRLSERYRVPLLLRFFEGRSFEEVARRLGLSEACVRQRVTRALAKLREFLSSRRVEVTSAVLAGGLVSGAVKAAPAGVIVSAAAAPTVLAGPAALLAHGVLGASTLLRAKVLAVLTSLLALASGVATVVTVQLQAAQPQRLPPTARALTALAPNTTAAPRPVKRLVLPRPTIGRQIGQAPPAGTVIDLHGSPLAGANVMLVTPRRPLTINDPQGFGGLRMITSGDGSFAFPAQEREWQIVVVHADGYAFAERASGNTHRPLQLQPWARVSGTVWSEDKPVAFAHVRLASWTASPSWQRQSVFQSESASTDANGHFAFTHVMPGPLFVARQWTGRIECLANYALDRAEAGKVTSVDIGRGGVTIVGRVKFDRISAEQTNPATRPALNYTGRLTRRTPPVFPSPPAGLTDRQLHHFYREWERSETGRETFHAQLTDQFPISPDGTFRLASVQPGAYVLTLVTYGQSDEHGIEVTTSADCDVTVPPAAALHGSTAVADLGTLTLRPAASVTIGRLQPPISIPHSGDSAAFELGHPLGRPVLLYFWDQRHLDEQEISRIRAWASGGHLAVIGINAADDQREAATAAAAHGMDWPQVHVANLGPGAADRFTPGETLLLNSNQVIVARHSPRDKTDAVSDALRAMGISP